MRADVVPLQSGTGQRLARSSLLTYRVPNELATSLQPGQLVTIPLGAQMALGLVWGLDASDEIDEVDDGRSAQDEGRNGISSDDEMRVGGERLSKMRAITSIVLDASIVSPAQRALVEWIADYYSAPLGLAARLALPPGLLMGVRFVLEPEADETAQQKSAATSADAPEPLPDPIAALRDLPAFMEDAEGEVMLTPDDAGAALSLLREQGRLERGRMVATLGARRGKAAFNTLLEQRAASLRAELPAALIRPRQERRVTLVGVPERLADWRAQARATLDTLLGGRLAQTQEDADLTQEPSAAQKDRAQRSRKRGPGVAFGVAANIVSVSQPHSATRSPEEQREERRNERRAERILRQLATLDALERSAPTPSPPPARRGRGDDIVLLPLSLQGEGVRGGGWRLEELRRLTRITPAAMAELVEADLVTIQTVEVRHDPLAGRDILRTAPLRLIPTQTHALETILAAGKDDTPHVCLLHGITGSGKTEVYLQALAAIITQGKRGLALVPEIALTPQAMARYAGRFPGRVALLHSGLTDAERLDEWRRIRLGEVDVVLGSRSALFAPIERLGLIIVDEEHEGAYKQDRAPTYHARDVAVRLGQLTGATVVLGSATPSVESYWRAQNGAYTLIEMRERATAAPQSTAKSRTHDTHDTHADDQDNISPDLPPVTIVDLRAELRAGSTSILSEPLQRALRETLDRREQAILFLNRRGTASCVLCRECGYVAKCEQCDVTLTYHAGEAALICHYCGHRQPAPQVCPLCWSASIRYFGLGSERVEATVKRMYPEARVLRWDRDTARTRQAHEELLKAFAERRANILVGTQMIAKGLDLPGVTLVGVVSADTALFLPDFRASERAFQLLTQVAGRAGRGAQPGRVIMQSFNPEHFCIQAAAHHDYQAFCAAELTARWQYGYPPFRRFVKLTYEHRDRYSAQIEAMTMAERLEHIIASLNLPATDIVGPAPAFIERLRGRYRWQLILRGADPIPVLRSLGSDLPFGWSLDVDPIASL